MMRFEIVYRFVIVYIFLVFEALYIIQTNVIVTCFSCTAPGRNGLCKTK